MARVSYRISPPRPSHQRSTRKMQPMKVWVLLLITMITNGIYIPIWYVQRLEVFNDLDSERKLSRKMLIFSTVISILVSFMPFVLVLTVLVIGPESNNPVDGSSIAETVLVIFTAVFGLFYLCAIVVGFYLVFVAFQTRRILMDHFGISLSVIWTFLFNVYYLQYHCNRLDFSEDILSQRSVFE